MKQNLHKPSSFRLRHHLPCWIEEMRLSTPKIASEEPVADTPSIVPDALATPIKSTIPPSVPTPSQAAGVSPACPCFSMKQSMKQSIPKTSSFRCLSSSDTFYTAVSFLSHRNMTSLNTLCFEKKYWTEGTMM